jgi:hypothetical protein
MQPQPVWRQEFAHPSTAGTSAPAQVAWQSPLPHRSAVELVQDLLLLPQLSPQKALSAQFMIMPSHDCPPPHLILQA